MYQITLAILLMSFVSCSHSIDYTRQITKVEFYKNIQQKRKLTLSFISDVMVNNESPWWLI